MIALFTAAFFICCLGYSLAARYLSDAEEILAAALPLGFLAVTSVLLGGTLITSRLTASFGITTVIIGWLFLKQPGVKFNKRHFLWVFIPALSAVLFVLKLSEAPLGSGMDSWALWRMKSMFLLYSDSFWQQVSAEPLSYASPDYPLHFPFLIAWFSLFGAEPVLSQQCVSLLVLIGITFLFLYAVRTGSNIIRGLLLLWVLSTPAVIFQSASLYADCLLALYVVAAVIFADRLIAKQTTVYAVLTGVMMGGCVLSKNDGWLWCAAIGLPLIIRARGKKFHFIVMGSLPFVALTFLAKAKTTFTSLILNAEGLSAVAGRVIERLHLIVLKMTEQVFNENNWVYGWFVILLVVFASRKLSSIASQVFITALCMIFAVYLFSALELEAHLNHSLNRVLLPLYLTGIYLCCRYFCRKES